MKNLKLALAVGVAFGGVAHAAAPAPKAKVDATYLRYENPGILAKIPNGQTIHIKCMGAGSPTVILSAGLGDWSAAWRKVQPQIAKTTRVCAWDRPGYGFSSGTTQPQTVANTTAALVAALKVAHVRGPYVAVGHSLGGYETLLFKDQNPRAVVGMVLVDPSIPDQHSRLAKLAPAFTATLDHFMAGNVAVYDRCLAGLKSGKLKLGSPDPDGCLSYPPDYPPELTKALATRDTNPLRFTASRSLTENFEADAELVVRAHRNYGDMPLIVLTATKDQKLPPNVPAPSEDQMTAFHAEWQRGHDQIAALSSRGVNRRVPNSTHYIQYDQPEAVIDAVNEVVRMARSKASGHPAHR
jgi:pimeloyl-ACP methyl ester carboxylesterase